MVVTMATSDNLVENEQERVTNARLTTSMCSRPCGHPRPADPASRRCAMPGNRSKSSRTPGLACSRPALEAKIAGGLRTAKRSAEDMGRLERLTMRPFDPVPLVRPANSTAYDDGDSSFARRSALPVLRWPLRLVSVCLSAGLLRADFLPGPTPAHRPAGSPPFATRRGGRPRPRTLSLDVAPALAHNAAGSQGSGRNPPGAPVRDQSWSVHCVP